MGNEEHKPQKKTYEKPAATKITREEARVKLMRLARMGDAQAKELLDILFGQEHEKPGTRGNDDLNNKKSA
jgi:hypothetical protein